MNEGHFEMYDHLANLYESLGYTVVLTSSLEGDGISDIKSLLKDKRTLISGQSGVGKSTLINAIEPGLGLRTEDISDYSGKGQHTTTFAEMFDKMTEKAPSDPWLVLPEEKRDVFSKVFQYVVSILKEI